MAEKTKKTFHKLRLSFDDDLRKLRIKEAKVLPFSELLEAYKEANGGNDLEKTGDLREFIKEEVKAINSAHYPDNNERKTTYESDNKGDPRAKKVGFVSDFFEAEDEFMKKHEDFFDEYTAKKAEAEGISDESERNIRLNELKLQYKESIASFEKCQKLYEKVEKYEETLKFLDKLPEKVLDNIVDTSKKLDTKSKSDNFEEAFAEMISQPAYISTGKESEDKAIENEHRFNVGKDSDVVTHTIRNLNGSGLDITFTGSEYTIACCNETMTKEQLKSLADYCFRYCITITDFGDLKGKDVVDKDNNPVGKIEPLYEEAIKENEKVDAGIDKITLTNDVEAPAIEGSYFGEFINNRGEIKSFDSKKVEEGAQKILSGISQGAVTDYSMGFGTSTISIYESEDDKNEDGEIEKNKVKHKKHVAITFNHFKNKATIYLGPKGKLSTGIVRIALDQYKAQGFKYFEIPPVNDEDGFGAAAQKTFFEASVKTGLPLLLKGPSGRGCDIGYHDLTDKDGIIDKAMEEYKDEPAKKIEYFMRWHQQLEKYTKTFPAKQGEFANAMEKLKQQANFTYFQKKFKGTIENIIDVGVDGTDGKQWDNVDLIAAKYAYTQIIKEIQAGHLGGKRYNPMDEAGNNERIKAEFERLRQLRRPKIEEEIDNNMNDLKRDTKNTDPSQKAMQNIQKAYDDAYKGLKEDLKGQEIDIDAKFPTPKRVYDPTERKSQRNAQQQRPPSAFLKGR